MKNYRVAVLGATGAVGREMLKILEEYNFPVGELLPLASPASAGKRLPFCGGEVAVRAAEESSFAGCDFVFGAVGNDLARRFAPAIKRAGAIFIDNSSAFRLDDGVPLVVPEINAADAFTHHGVIANPNCSTIITLMALAPLAHLSPIETMVAATYQAVSGAGVGGMRDLENGVRAYLDHAPDTPSTFPHPIAFNLIPKIGSSKEQGYTSEEMKLQYEGRKILHLPEMRVSCTCVRVPVMRSHSIAATAVFRDKISLDDARAALQTAPGVKFVDDLDADLYPMPLLSSDTDTVFVGRLRQDLTNERGISLFCCGDQLRKGAATNAVQIARLFV